MILYVLSAKCSALEKENACLVVQDLVTHRLLNARVDLKELMADLLKVVNLKKQPARCEFG